MSSIKGGGRAVMSSDAQEMIISLLYDTRHPNNPLLPRLSEEESAKKDQNDNEKEKMSTETINAPSPTRLCFADLKDREKRKVRKRFLKQLVRCHNLQTLAMKMNGGSNEETIETVTSSITPSAVASVKDDEKTNSIGLHDASTKKAIETTARTSNSERVRVEIVEAIFKDSSSSKKSSSKKSSSSSTASKKSKDKSTGKEKSKKSSTSTWKEGTRKTIVVPKSTSIKDFLKTCKSKLNMKKKPTRVFYMDKETNMEMTLRNDLSGLVDGSVVYITSHEDKVVVAAANTKSDNKGKTQSRELIDEENYVEEDESFTFIDPLDAVKRAYQLQKKNLHNKSTMSPTLGSLERLPRFQDSLENLESLSEARSKLPAANYREQILTSLDTSRVIVICGATGCGKSTQIPQYILEGMKAIGHESNANIIVTQPRRVAATSLAMRVANERLSPPPGQPNSQIGYNVRLSKALAETTKVTYCTVGILLRMLVNPKESDFNNNSGDEEEIKIHDNLKEGKGQNEKPHVPLSNVSHIIIDEVHERDLNTDFALTLLRPLLRDNKHISIVLMSATASSELFVNYFRSQRLNIEPKVFRIPGRTFPVETKWLPDCEKLVSGRLNGWKNNNGTQTNQKGDCLSNPVRLSPRATSRIDNDFIANLVKRLSMDQWGKDESKANDEGQGLTKENGAILVFLPGKGEIQSLAKTLYQDPMLGNKNRCCILQLHSSLPPAEQWRAFQPVKYGIVKIILATNVAETSITIPDISVVIDTGRVKESRYNSASRIRELVTVWTSEASMKQRAGRAGRTGPGVCYKMYTEEFCDTSILSHTPPEIVRTPLEELVLQVCLLKEQQHGNGTSPMEFLSKAPEPPSEDRLNEACTHLVQIGALVHLRDEKEACFRLTPLGYHLSHLPMDPKVGKMLVVGCVLQCIEPALTIAASLSCSKSCWLPFIPGVENSKDKARELQQQIIEDGFGGRNWKYGTVKGDLIGVIAVFNAWATSSNREKERKKFASQNALDHNALIEMQGLRTQFKDSLRASGLLIELNRNYTDDSVSNNMNASLVTCCLVAGLYPNIATLMRPSRKHKIFAARLITKNGDSCKASSSSFQQERLKRAREDGKDAYAVYHSKHLFVGSETDDSQRTIQQVFLSEINFVSRFAIILFGGQIEVRKNFLLVDEWLKFKVADEEESKSALQFNAVLLQELRSELDNTLLNRISGEPGQGKNKRVIETVMKLLSEEMEAI